MCTYIKPASECDVSRRVRECEELTPFRRRVYLALLEVPPGHVTTYGELGARIGCGSARAVGQALKRNPLAPDVPCHRVVAADLSLGGFAGQRDGEQLERKAALLRGEGVPVAHGVVEDLTCRHRFGTATRCRADE